MSCGTYPKAASQTEDWMNFAGRTAVSPRVSIRAFRLHKIGPCLKHLGALNSPRTSSTRMLRRAQTVRLKTLTHHAFGEVKRSFKTEKRRGAILHCAVLCLLRY